MIPDRDLYLSQCKRRFGAGNPERLNPEPGKFALWEWMVRTGKHPHFVRSDLDLEANETPWSAETGYGAPDPDWCFERFGMSRTRMHDGRILCVGGEHEDFYDPDFCIYNDVIVLRPEAGHPTCTTDSGQVEIYGYPRDNFPPTDFHTATLVGSRLLLIGRLGYDADGRLGPTPVFALDTDTYKITRLDCVGNDPGWIFEHHAWLDAGSHAITVRGGRIVRPEFKRTQRFQGVYRLHLDGLRWECVSPTDGFRRFEIEAVECGENFAEPGGELFRPTAVPHTWLEPLGSDDCRTFQIDVSGARISFEPLYSTIRVTIEGTLPPATHEAVFREILANLCRCDAEWQLCELDPNGDWHERK